MASRRHFFLLDILTQDRRCLWCGGGDVHPSKHPLRLLSVLRYQTWRCHSCGRRFPLRPGGSTPPEFVRAARRRRPAGEELRPLDDALANLLKPGPIEGPETPEPSRHVALEQRARPRRSQLPPHRAA